MVVSVPPLVFDDARVADVSDQRNVTYSDCHIWTLPPGSALWSGGGETYSLEIRPELFVVSAQVDVGGVGITASLTATAAPVVTQQVSAEVDIGGVGITADLTAQAAPSVTHQIAAQVDVGAVRVSVGSLDVLESVTAEIGVGAVSITADLTAVGAPETQMLSVVVSTGRIAVQGVLTAIAAPDTQMLSVEILVGGVQLGGDLMIFGAGMNVPTPSIGAALLGLTGVADVRRVEASSTAGSPYHTRQRRVVKTGLRLSFYQKDRDAFRTTYAGLAYADAGLLVNDQLVVDDEVFIVTKIISTKPHYYFDVERLP